MIIKIVIVMLVLAIAYLLYKLGEIEDVLALVISELEDKVKNDDDYRQHKAMVEHFLENYGLGETSVSLWDFHDLPAIRDSENGKKPVHRRELKEINTSIEELNKSIALIDRAIKDERVLNIIQEKVKVEKTIEQLVKEVKRMEDELN